MKVLEMFTDIAYYLIIIIPVLIRITSRCVCVYRTCWDSGWTWASTDSALTPCRSLLKTICLGTNRYSTAIPLTIISHISSLITFILETNQPRTKSSKSSERYWTSIPTETEIPGRLHALETNNRHVIVYISLRYVTFKSIERKTKLLTLSPESKNYYVAIIGIIHIVKLLIKIWQTRGTQH